MTNNNKIFIENKIPFETEYKIPSYEEFLINYDGDERVNYEDLVNSDIGEIRGYGPCKNSHCGCCCSNIKCDCKNPEFSICKKDNQKIGNINASGSSRNWDDGMSVEADFTFFRETRHDGDLKVLSVSAGVDVTRTGILLKGGVNAFDFKTHGVGVKVGLNADTGGSISANGLELKAAGVGFSIGKKIGVSLPVGEVSVDVSENCNIQ
ncbi:hypothetical protein [endosymbiont GvMRE of Glomus versiforme]|uniref:hypothetical protein n=1 Tax=endosymbiont GvMRE of Glomus versiforme TaxID=2039283 RepID=UPI000ED3ED0A|nr:hypothetical protein [endosymbiont GvMRE of Glomus versiforme]RHZ35692.1 hypothetical protein GvMRE_IIg446 [endosymbiont GvMRE of Glomus versiforme]